MNSKTENKFRWRPNSARQSEETKAKPKTYRLNLKIKKQPENIDQVFKKYDSLVLENKKLNNIIGVIHSFT
jgi:hypothetical protein